MKCLLLTSFLAVAFALPLAAQVNDTYVIPAAANVGGAFGTQWLTQFSLFNPQLDYPLKVSVTFLPTGGGQGIEALLPVPPNSEWFTDNALKDIFGVAGTGSLLLATFAKDNPTVPDTVIARSFLITTNTFNNSRSGTFGQTIPGVWAGLQDFNTDGISGIAHGIRNLSSAGWRTNIGAVNLGRRSVVMSVTVYDANGHRLLDRAPFTVPPLGHVQDVLPVQVDRGSVEFWIDDPSKEAVVFPYTSTIDQLSGDPTYQTPTLLATPNVLFGKKGMPAVTATVNPGKKIDNSFALAIRATAAHIGEVSMKAAAQQ
ncbi:MAG: hypothetical protein JWO56_3390 [Acidobacteria bacterium]|nr:hypothetical protein [Acidobacteriota bacterium]